MINECGAIGGTRVPMYAKVITRSTGKATGSLIPEGRDGYIMGCFFAENFIMLQ
jgi:hypothetical protein